MTYTLDELRAIPVFLIVGKGRSGTTLLSTILDSHPEVASATESRFVLLIWQKYKSMKSWKPENAETFYEDVMKDYNVKYLWEIDKVGFINQLKSLPENTQIEDLIKLVYLFRVSSFPKNKIKFIVDKNPVYTIFIPKLKKVFTTAKLIRIVRDPRDNVASHIKHTPKNASFIAYKWSEYNKLIDNFEEQNPRSFLTLRFEDLITDKASFFSEIEKFTKIQSLLGLEEKRIGYKDQIESKFNDRLKNQHQASLKPLDVKKVGHFRDKLTDNQIQKIENICFPYAERYAYKKAMPVQSFKILNRISSYIKYQIHTVSSLILYNLPYWMIIPLYDFFLKHIMKRMKNKIDQVIINNEK